MKKKEGSDDGGGVDSKLTVILLPFITVDADVDMEVFVTLEVFARLNMAMVAAAAAAAGAGGGGGDLAGGIYLFLPITNIHAH